MIGDPRTDALQYTRLNSRQTVARPITLRLTVPSTIDASAMCGNDVSFTQEWKFDQVC